MGQVIKGTFVAFAGLLAALAIACAGSGAAQPTAGPVEATVPPAPTATPEPGSAGTPAPARQVAVPAPIDGVEIEAGDSAAQAYVVVKSGLPNGCARFGGYDLKREGDTIRVEVTNLVPADKDTMCTMVYGTVESRIPVGGDLLAGKTYSVEVNGVTIQFVAERSGGAPSRYGQTGAATVGAPFELRVGEATTLEPEGITVRFEAVLEDSRCPTNVTCIQAGQVRIMVSLARGEDGLGRVELSLGARGALRSAGGVGGYAVRLLALEPYPRLPASGPGAANIATLVVSAAASGG